MNKFFYFLIYYFKKLQIFILNIIAKQYSIKTIRIGSEYGGKFIPVEILNREVDSKFIVSCGAGTDVSFDIEMINLYSFKVLILDPTPESKNHIKKIFKNLGKKNLSNYVMGGKQDIKNYDLSNVSDKNLIYIDKAIFDESKRIEFYKPKDKNFVSHSLEKTFHKNDEHIIVQSTTIDQIMLENNLNKNDFMIFKLDIEGAENRVIVDLLNKKIYPKVLLFEYDFFNFHYLKNFSKFIKLHFLLLKSGYIRVKNEDFPEMTYIQKSQ